MKLALVAALLMLLGTARAQVGSVAPGKLAKPHAAFEAQCNRCHAPFGGVPAERCLACHTQLAERVARGVGFHATVTATPCIACHRDHRGRAAALAPPPPDPFDHRVATFRLDGKHAQLACARCHPAAGASRKWVGIPTACGRCHADTAHRGALGGACAKCHRAEGWAPATRTLADHAVPLGGGHAKLTCADCHRSGLHLVARQACSQCHTARHGGTARACDACHRVAGWTETSYAHAFPPSRLPGKHETAPCLACHPKFRFSPTPFACAACHDKQRPHAPLGECTNCHSPLSWKTTAFDHDAPRVGFALTGRHRGVGCDACHAGADKFKAQAVRACESCHADVHRAQFAGRACAACHTADGWRPSKIGVAEHARFALRGAHARASCASCHRGGAFAGTATACAGCHADTRHRDRFGAQCARCHDETAWSPAPRFQHAETGFALDRGHGKVACARCHGADHKRAATAACQSCHASPHSKQFGTACVRCHNTTSFRAVARFDHARTDFPLELRHAALPCKACHDAKQRPLAHRACRTCHGDPHRGGNAFDCADCHRPDRWRIVRFDHDLTAYPLTGRHRIAACGGCHTNPNWTGVRTDCAACHAFDRPRDRVHLTQLTCDDCHSTTNWRAR